MQPPTSSTRTGTLQSREYSRRRLRERSGETSSNVIVSNPSGSTRIHDDQSLPRDRKRRVMSSPASCLALQQQKAENSETGDRGAADLYGGTIG